MRRLAATILGCLAAIHSSASDLDIVGRWSIQDDTILPTTIIFAESGDLDVKVPGVAFRTDCTYKFDARGAPGQLEIKCEPLELKISGRFWVTFYTPTTIHIQGDPGNPDNPADGLFFNVFLEKIGD